MLRRIWLPPIMLLVRVRGRPADVGHERRDDAPARARARKPPVFRPIRAPPPHPHPACLAHRRQPRVPTPHAPHHGQRRTPHDPPWVEVPVKLRLALALARALG
ncbi:hypothetical protein C8J57DRAFT_1354089, partial [Mycena rebaudengoi]